MTEQEVKFRRDPLPCRCHGITTMTRVLFGLTILTAIVGTLRVHVTLLNGDDSSNGVSYHSQVEDILSFTKNGHSTTKFRPTVRNDHDVGDTFVSGKKGFITTTDWMNSKNNISNDTFISSTSHRDEDEDDDNSSSSSNNNTKSNHTKTSPLLHFIPYDQLRERDYFSDSWFLNRRRFLDLPLEQIGIVEDAVFVAVSHNKRPMNHCRMLVDWLQFGVEHLSKWWNELQVWVYSDDNPQISLLPTVLNKIDHYLQHNVHPPPIDDATTTTTETKTTTFHNAIAMIAFVAYKPKPRQRQQFDRDQTRRNALNERTLAATIASLYQAGFGRVVMVGIHQQEDAMHFRNAVTILQSLFPSPLFVKNSTTTTNTTIHIGISNMELQHVHVHNSEWITTNFARFNIPRAAIAGMQAALRNELSIHEQQQWLGISKTTDHWKYFYLTEPDTILHTQPHVLPKLKMALDQGLSLFPHRLHVIPHEADLPPTLGGHKVGDAEYVLNAGEFLPNIGHFANITDLNPFAPKDGANYISCCDDGRYWPGVDGSHWKKCKPWWTCGRKKIDYDKGQVYNATAIANNNPRLLPYPMMRLNSGTGAVFASSNHGRRCLPSKTGCILHRYLNNQQQR
ncbi:hypothetical protein IV203_007739 [Nitzschia inconspicua]|uniref:Uncharacterized protein n=1 Tax=Nitzschia inconspicua TaxID=303405 RepID=A0A9K3KYX2_9STRA|nr:hypothetical protein IV203_007739 [Nitzschia inconspicua]